ncbi:phytoene desaturase [candidate division KSB1 bacterium]|nr:phytoene desaturase [candidate division KSB1 bacterium]
MSKRVLVIGAGLGALSGAIRLARMGFEVHVYEKNASAGGKLNERQLGGYRFDTGPSLLTMPFVIDELFEFAGAARAKQLAIAPIEPICRYFFSDGATLDASANPVKMRAAIARFSQRDAAAYEKFLQYSERIYQRTAEIFLFSPIHELAKLLTLKNLGTLLHLREIDPLRTMHESVVRFFADERLVQLFDRYATYNGSNPYRAPATLNIIPYVEYVLGSYYIRGGMYRLAEALLELANQVGVQVQYSVPVQKILHDGKRATGLQIEGEQLAADYVLCGQDVVVAHEQLIGGFEGRRKKLARLEPSCSGLVFMWGVRTRHERLAHHNIFFARDYHKEFEQIFEQRVPPDDSTIYVAITSKSDPEHAPAGCENWFVLLNMPYLTSALNWIEVLPKVRALTLEKLRRFGFDLEGAIEQEDVITPEDFYRFYRSNRGSIYGLSSNSRSAAFKRPSNRSRELRGLYFAGGSTHPGGGIPLVMLSGKIAAELIAEASHRS